MDTEFFIKIIIANPWVAYAILAFVCLLGGILVWRASKGDEVSLFGLQVQSNERLKELQQQYKNIAEDNKQQQYVINALRVLSGEIAKLIARDYDRFEEHRNGIYRYFLSSVMASMAINKANNPKVCIFVDAGDGTLKVHEAAAHSPEGMKKLRLSIADSAAGYTFTTGEIFFSGEIHTPGSRFRKHPKAQSTYHSLICVPIQVGDQVLGVLSVTGDEEKSYTEDEKSYLSAFSNSIAPLLYMELKGKVPIS
jgi:transcriptional regulator with GAF, ATPase, and Fis domain